MSRHKSVLVNDTQFEYHDTQNNDIQQDNPIAQALGVTTPNKKTLGLLEKLLC